MSDQHPTEAMMRKVDSLSEQMLDELSNEEVVALVRDFCGVMMEWQPNLMEFKDDAMRLGLGCLSTAQLFIKAFIRAYDQTDKHLQAVESLKKTFENS